MKDASYNIVAFMLTFQMCFFWIMFYIEHQKTYFRIVVCVCLVWFLLMTFLLSTKKKLTEKHFLSSYYRQLNHNTLFFAP